MVFPQQTFKDQRDALRYVPLLLNYRLLFLKNQKMERIKAFSSFCPVDQVVKTNFTLK